MLRCNPLCNVEPGVSAFPAALDRGRMMIRRSINITILIIVTLCVAGVISACSSPAPTAAPKPTATEPSRITPLAPSTATLSVPANGETIARSRCTACHTLERVQSSKKNHDQWMQTVNRMIPSLSSTEQDVLVDFLVKTYES
jgi:cytochrome c5